jgi:hypothetical protein
MTVELVMSYTVLLLFQLHATSPYQLHDVMQGLLVRTVAVGLLISLASRI